MNVNDLPLKTTDAVEEAVRQVLETARANGVQAHDAAKAAREGVHKFSAQFC